jgi:hypothetical protein
VDDTCHEKPMKTKEVAVLVAAMVAVALGGSGCAALDVEANRRDQLRREFASGGISQREYQQQLEQIDRALAEQKAAQKK